MTSVLFVAAFAMVMIGIGLPVVSRLDRGNRLIAGERVVLSYLVGCFAIYFGVFAIGSFRLDGVTMWSWAGVLAVASVFGLRRANWSLFRETVAGEIRAARSDPWLAILWIVAFGVAVTSLLQGLAPPDDYDSLMYHLANPKYDLELGRLGIDWARDSGIQTFLFPAMASNLSRFALATMNDSVAQMLHGMLGVAGAIGAGFLTRRVGFGKSVAIAAVIFYLVIRVIVWEMATAVTDIPVAAFGVSALVAYYALRERPSFGVAAIFGLMVAGGILAKYHGFALAATFGPVMLYDLVRRRIRLAQWITGPAVSLAMIIPHLARNFAITGNPLFPMFNNVFNPGKPVFFIDTMFHSYGAGVGALDLILKPWRLSVMPMHYFDGMVLGAPYLLAFAPLLLLQPARARRWGPALSVVVVYYFIWAFMLGQQVRFAIPIMPMLAALAATGAAVLWDVARPRAVMRAAVVALFVVVAANQAIFVGIYSLLRLPVAFGLMDATTYLTQTPTLNGSKYVTCRYITEHLKPGERYFSMAYPHSYYCPQRAVTWTYFKDEAKWWLETETPPKMSPAEFVRRCAEANFKFFFIPKAAENRRTDDGRSIVNQIDMSKRRFGDILAPALTHLKPLIEGPYSAVYDGPQVIAEMRKLLP